MLDFDKLSLDTRFDLIWCGSLVTHLNQTDIKALLEFFKRHLVRSGVLVLTTMGDYVARRLPTQEFDYGLENGQIPNIIAEYEKSGFGFEFYPEGSYDISEKCGVTITSREWIRACVRDVGSLREVYSEERGWDRHQDVFGFVSES